MLDIFIRNSTLWDSSRPLFSANEESELINCSIFIFCVNTSNSCAHPCIFIFPDGLIVYPQQPLKVHFLILFLTFP